LVHLLTWCVPEGSDNIDIIDESADDEEQRWVSQSQDSNP